jgi:oxygen-dependent protoporphyrinogen oxidase
MALENRVSRQAAESAKLLREIRGEPAATTAPPAQPEVEINQPPVDPARPRRIVVIGGGIAGLAAAYRLAMARSGAEIVLLEAGNRLGGKIVTERIGDLVIEGGPDSFLSMKPRGIGLAREIGLESRLIGTIPENKRSFVSFGGTLHQLPEGLSGLVPTNLGAIARSPLLSLAGKSRLALDYVLPASTSSEDETLGAFIERRLGKEAYERLVEPLMAGIYAGDGRRLSLAATFPQLRAAERAHGGLIKGVLANRPSSPTASALTPFVSFEGGLRELVDRLERDLRDRGVVIRTGAPAVALRKDASGYRVRLATGEEIAADGAIVATPAKPAAELVGSDWPAAGEALRAIPHVSTAIVALAFPKTVPLDGYGYVIPRIAGRPVLACTWVSSKWPRRAPVDLSLVRVFIGRAGEAPSTERSDEELLRIALDELRETVGITSEPMVSRIYRWVDGMPQYTLGHLERVAAVETAIASAAGLAIAGHAYRGVGIPDCIASGEHAAERVLAAIPPQSAR